MSRHHPLRSQQRSHPGSDRPVWHHLTVEETAATVQSPADGLSDGEPARRRAIAGSNDLAQRERTPGWRRFLRQFDNVLIQVLLAAGATALALGEIVDAGVILAVVLINGVVGHLQEGKAERALEAIRGLLAPRAVVLRDGRAVALPAEELVPGDRVILTAGDRVPADLRLYRCHDLAVQEAVLTGESLPVPKSIPAVPADAGIGDRSCIAHAGTFVTRGEGAGIVVATGAATELGRIGTLMAEVETLATPLIQRMGRFGTTLSIAILVLAAGVFAFGTLVRGEPWSDMVMAAVALAVAAVPEGLPAVMTITLAIGVTRMARRNAIIRRLPAVETLGSVDVICADKTGTLTANALSVQTVLLPRGLNDADTLGVSGSGYAPEGHVLNGASAVRIGDLPMLDDLLRAVVLCNDAQLAPADDGVWRMVGDPVDGALLTLAHKAGVDPASQRLEWQRLDSLPFDADRRYMATLHRDPAGSMLLIVKGAPEQVVTMCSTRSDGKQGGERFDRAAWLARAEALAGAGQRVLAIAAAQVTGLSLKSADPFPELGFLGLCGIMDPPREAAVKAVAACRGAGIRVKMITGDHAATARAIGEQFGLGADARVLTGSDLDSLDDRALRRAAGEGDIFARVTPGHKLRLVEALQANGQTVAMTGDGVNDAPALKRADIGVAMGRDGSEAAKEAADMVLTDDNFATIAAAVAEGRTIYDNLRKTILFLLPTNGAQGLVIVAAVLAGVPVPITPLQILWINMVSAVTLGLALAFETAESDVMTRSPRPATEGILSRTLVIRMVVAMGLLVAVSFCFYFWHAAEPAMARTMAVNGLVAGEIAFLFNTRMLDGTALSRDGLFGSTPVWISVATIVGLQLAFTHLPVMQALFGTVAVGWQDWAAGAAGGGVVFLAIELEKAVSRRLRRA